jgi:hypothetical protein
MLNNTDVATVVLVAFGIVVVLILIIVMLAILLGKADKILVSKN